MFEIDGKYTTAKIMIDNVEPECISQIQAMTNHIAFSNPISIMPDTHAGKGSVIGFTMPVGDKIIPNVVGVDIGCGMLAMNIGRTELDDLKYIDETIREYIPFGINIRPKEHILAKHFDNDIYDDLFKRVGIDKSYALRSMGTVGGGNHFIEFGKDSKGDIWITVHSGSRHLGKKVCEYWQDKGFKRIVPTINIDDIKNAYPKHEWSARIKEAKDGVKKYKKSDLDWIDGADKDGYLHDMWLTQLYADMNRNAIQYEISQILGFYVYNDVISTTHNYIDPKDNIIRKGAIRSYIGEKMVIPFNPVDGILICEGKSNPDWNYSAPHGSGRILSRSEAKRTITEDMAKEIMVGVYSSVMPVDESPLVYKSSSAIENAIEPTARIIDKIIPFMNMKSEE